LSRDGEASAQILARHPREWNTGGLDDDTPAEDKGRNVAADEVLTVAGFAASV
jgi:hypothetical protein